MYICIYIRDGREESITLIALCFYRHLLTFGILACLHTARHVPHRNLIHFICFVPTACVSGATQKMYTFASENFVCVYANSSLPVHQPSSFVTSSTRVIDSPRPSLIFFLTVASTSKNCFKKSFILRVPLEGARVPPVVRVPQIENG